MSGKINLPNDLVEIEASLAQLPLPASSLDRDELLFRAGWAAAEAKLVQPSASSHWVWPVTSAALAATVLMLLLPLGTERVDTEETMQLATTQPAPVVHSQASLPASETPPEHGFVNRFDSPMSVLSLRHRAMLRDFDKASGDIEPPDIALDDTPSPPTKTTRELLYELLPELQKPTDEDAQQNELWTWPKQLWEALS